MQCLYVAGTLTFSVRLGKVSDYTLQLVLVLGKRN